MGSRYYDSYGAEGEEIRPGRISDELKEALNLPENDVPPWIYRMRALGYPPGWLKKAIVDTNDIFDTDAQDEESNSKKRKHSSSQNEVQYDHSKLIEYPGFNTPMPKNCVDYHFYVNMPAMLEHQQLEYAKKHMNLFKPAELPKRAKMDSVAGAVTSDDSNDISSSLEQSKDDDTPASPDDNSDKPSTEPDVSSKSLNASMSTTSLKEEIKLVSKGSPMPTPRPDRAPLEKFSEGVVGELLYFENLPSSTGKFESIRGLLNNMRRSKSEADTSFHSNKSDG